LDQKKELTQGFKISLGLSLLDDYSSSYRSENIRRWWGAS
jgi:hypothetical protein